MCKSIRLLRASVAPITLAVVLSLLAAAGPRPLPKRITVRFSPHGGCAELVSWHVDLAKSEVFVGSYQWSSRPVHDAVVRAKVRGLKVRVILDPVVEHSPLTGELVAAGFTADELRIDDRHAIFHDKVILRDPADPAHAAHENGSFNFSAQSDARNAENAQVVEGFPDVTAAYQADLETHWAHARPVKSQ